MTKPKRPKILHESTYRTASQYITRYKLSRGHDVIIVTLRSSRADRMDDRV